MTRQLRILLAASLVAAGGVLFTGGSATGTGATCFGRPATIVGTFGNDVIHGTSGDDVIVSLSGEDTIFAAAGDDLVCAGTGEDAVVGGHGNDTIAGDGDADMLFGGPGTDRLYGDTPGTVASGADVLFEGAGGGSLFGGPGSDLVLGGTASTSLHGGNGSDLLVAGTAGSALDGGRGTDRCLGGSQRSCETTLHAPPVCPPAPNAFAGVYWPHRLELKSHCATIHGKVKGAGVSPDGDLGIGVVRSDPGHVGQLVHVEFMPRDVGRLARPASGDRITLTGEYVLDTNHTHYEVHPVFREVIKRRLDGIAIGAPTGTARTYRTGPRSGGNPFGSNAICIRFDATLCEGWSGTLMAGESSSSPLPPWRPGAGSGRRRAGSSERGSSAPSASTNPGRPWSARSAQGASSHAIRASPARPPWSSSSTPTPS